MVYWKDGKVTGFLVDWELAKKLDVPVSESDTSQASAPKFVERTVSWQFLSCRLMMDQSSPNTVLDDLESFVHVLIYACARYARALGVGEAIAKARALVLAQFDRLHGKEKAAFLITESIEPNGWYLKDIPFVAKRLSTLLPALAGMFSAVYTGDPSKNIPTHDGLMHVLEEALKDPEWKTLKDEIPQYTGGGLKPGNFGIPEVDEKGRDSYSAKALQAEPPKLAPAPDIISTG